MRIPVDISPHAEDVTADSLVSSAAVCVDMDDVIERSQGIPSVSHRSSQPPTSSSDCISLPPALGQFVGRAIEKLLCVVERLLQLQARCVVLVFGVTDSLEDAAVRMQVYQHVMRFADSTSRRCQVYVNTCGTALVGIRALLSNYGDDVMAEKRSGLSPPWKRTVVCSSNPLAAFMGLDCVQDLLSFNGFKLSMVRASKLAEWYGLDDTMFLPVFAVIASRKVSSTETAPSPFLKEESQVISRLVNQRAGSLCMELLQNAELLPPDGHDSREAHELLFEVVLTLAELRAEGVKPPRCSDFKSHQRLLPVLFHRAQHGVVRLGSRDMHARFAAIRSMILYAILPMKLARVAYCGGEGNEGGVEVVDVVKETGAVSAPVGAHLLDGYLTNPPASVLAHVLRIPPAAVGEGPAGREGHITAAELDDVRRLPGHLQLYAVALKILYRGGVLKEAVCRAVCGALVLASQGDRDVTTEDVCRDANLMGNDDECPSAQEINEGLQQLHVCWTYVALANDIFRCVNAPTTLRQTPLLRNSDDRERSEILCLQFVVIS